MDQQNNIYKEIELKLYCENLIRIEKDKLKTMTILNNLGIDVLK
jgi:hypothetical protein